MFAPFPKKSEQSKAENKMSLSSEEIGTKTEKIETDKKLESEKQNGHINVNNAELNENKTATSSLDKPSEKSSKTKKNNQKRNRRRKPKAQVTKSGDEPKPSEQEAGSTKREDNQNEIVLNGSADGNKTINSVKEEDGGAKNEETRRPGNDYAMAYVVANRSACLYFMHLYKECIADINLTFELGYPADLVYKLHERKAKCYVQLGQNQDAIESLQKATQCVADTQLDKKAKKDSICSLGNQIQQIKEGKIKLKSTEPELVFIKDKLPSVKGEMSRKFTCASTAFKMAVDDKRGRHIIADEDVAIADVITCEEPYSSVLYPEYHKTHCNR